MLFLSAVGEIRASLAPLMPLIAAAVSCGAILVFELRLFHRHCQCQTLILLESASVFQGCALAKRMSE